MIILKIYVTRYVRNFAPNVSNHFNKIAREINNTSDVRRAEAPDENEFFHLVEYLRAQRNAEETQRDVFHLNKEQRPRVLGIGLSSPQSEIFGYRYQNTGEERTVYQECRRRDGRRRTGNR